MGSSDSSEDSRENRGISPENSPSQETHVPELSPLDFLALVATETLDLELRLETEFDFNWEQSGKNQRGPLGDAAETSAAGERVTSEAERQEERWMINYKMHQKYVYERAKRFARNLHSDLHNDESHHHRQGHKKQKRIQEDGEDDDSGGPFQKAMEAIKNRRDSGSDVARSKLFSGGGGEEKGSDLGARAAPSLLELSLTQLGKNAEALVSLGCIPGHLRSKIASLVSGLGAVNRRFMKLLVRDSPAEICVKNCTNLVEKDLTSILNDCDTDTLRVLKLDLCGRSMTEHVIRDFLSGSSKGFPELTSLSLKGAFSLTDDALALISRSAPLLQWVNLSECSLLSDTAIPILAYHFKSTLKGLNIDGCQGINLSKFLGALKRFQTLSSLSIAGLDGTNDDFVLRFLEQCGSNLTSLVLASCLEVTDNATRGIGRYCPRLRVLDVSFLDKLTDMSLQYIANGCRSLRTLKCCRNRFSDEAVAAFLEVSGGSLNVLSLNNIRKVSQNTAISLANVSKKLHSLDLSWCRNLKDEDLRLILRSCPSLRQLKRFRS